TPLANGPRHCGQLFKRAALSQAPPPSANAVTASRQPRSNRDESIIRNLYTPCSSWLKAAIPRAHDRILRRLNRKERRESRLLLNVQSRFGNRWSSAFS